MLEMRLQLIYGTVSGIWTNTCRALPPDRFILHRAILVIFIMIYTRKVKSGFIVSTISLPLLQTGVFSH